ncbi:hypothetical protein HDC33_000347 [Sporosarcina sp. JAI121]|nr:hypothetical protein [Sporosarcina sp. JAI121]
MEKLVLYIPDLEFQFYRKKGFQESITQLSCGVSNTTSSVIYASDERKLYFRSVAFGTMKFHLVLLDFKYNTMTFLSRTDVPGDINQGVHELLSSLQFNFQPQKMSFVMERPENKNYTK